jgi:hypothetical protein
MKPLMKANENHFLRTVVLKLKLVKIQILDTVPSYFDVTGL